VFNLDKNKELAIELTKALIQNNNVKPVYNASPRYDDSEKIRYMIDEFQYTFSSIVTHFLENIENIEKWDD